MNASGEHATAGLRLHRAVDVRPHYQRASVTWPDRDGLQPDASCMFTRRLPGTVNVTDPTGWC
jgi:hypothetical protein